MSQIVFTHIVTNRTTWNASIAVSSGTAHLGIRRFLAASKLPNMCGTTWATAGLLVLADLSNGVVLSGSRGMSAAPCLANQPPDFSVGPPVAGAAGGDA